MRRTGNYYTNRHSCFLLQYHMVLVTKYRAEFLTGEVRDYVYDIIRDTLQSRGDVLVSLNGEADHVHILFETDPNTPITETANVLKTRTARLTRKRFPKIMKQYFWGKQPLFWTDSYFVTTVGYAGTEAVTAYIQKQGIHPRPCGA